MVWIIVILFFRYKLKMWPHVKTVLMIDGFGFNYYRCVGGNFWISCIVLMYVRQICKIHLEHCSYMYVLSSCGYVLYK